MFDLAYKALKFYYDKAKDKLPFEDYDEFIYYYRVDQFLLNNYNELVVHDDFLEEFNKVLKIVDNDNDVKSAMNTLAKKTIQGRTPSSSSFFEVLSDRVLEFTMEDAKIVLEKSSQDIKNVAVAGVGIYLVYMAIGLGSIFFLRKAFK
jgi:hypothetical protein